MSPRRANSSIMRSRESSVEPMSNCSSASGGWVCADAAAVMQAVESQTLILYHTDLRGEWPRAAAGALGARLPYGKRLATRADSPGARARLRRTRRADRRAARPRARLQHLALRPLGGVRCGQMRSRWLRCRDGERGAHRDFCGARGGPQGLWRRDRCLARGAPERRACQLARRAAVCPRARVVCGSGCVCDDQLRGARAHGARAVARGAVCAMSVDDDGGLRNTLYRTATRSGRRMTPARRWLYRLAVPLGLAMIRAWWFTCRVTRVEGVAHLDEALARHGHPRLLDPHRRAGAARLLPGARQGQGLAGHHSRRAARAALQVQARRAAAGADVGPADPADVVRRLARVADQVGQVRDPDALFAHRDRHRAGLLRAAGHRRALARATAIADGAGTEAPLRRGARS